MNIPCIALCDSDSPLQYVDIAIPCNNRTTEAISMIYWLLAREIMVLRGKLGKDEEWEVKVDLFFYKNPADIEPEDQKEEDPELEKEEEKPQDKVDEAADFGEDS